MSNQSLESTDGTVLLLPDKATSSDFHGLALALAGAAIIFDGLDQQILGFAIPSIAREWHQARAAFAPVVVAGLLGMTTGTFIAGLAGDRFGRRLVLIISMLIFGALTVGLAFAGSTVDLLAIRFVAGIGLGGAMPTVTAYAAEFTKLRHRALAVTATIVGVPVGGIVGGALAAQILPSLGWRGLFLVGGILPILLAGVLVIWLPETPHFLVARGVREQRGTAAARPWRARQARDAIVEEPAEPNIAALLAHGMRINTLSLWSLLFASMISVNLVYSWLPTILDLNGYDVGMASYGLALFNIGGVAGALGGAWLIGRAGSRTVMITLAIIGASASALLSIWLAAPTGRDMAMLAVAGFAIGGVQTNAFALAAHIYPVQVRATGIGTAVALGRLGAVLASFLGAAALTANRGLMFFPLITLMSASAILPLLAIRSHIPGRADAERD